MKNVLELCVFNAPYKGNFLLSLQKLDALLNENGSKIVYLFHEEAKDKPWVGELESTNTVLFYSDSFRHNVKLLKKIIKEQNIGYVHSHFTNNKLDLAVYLATKGKNIKNFKHYHNHILRGKGIKQLVAQRVFKNYQLIAVGDSVRDNVVEKIPGCNCVSVPNGIDFDRFDNYKKLKRLDYAISDSAVICMMMGFDFYRKGIDLAINTICELRKKQEIVLMITMAVNREENTKLIEEMLGSLPPWIMILPPREDIATYYNFCDIFLTPSREEGQCYSLLEAAYCKKPLVSSDCKGLIENQVPNTFYFSSNDQKDFEENLQLAIDKKKDFDKELEEAKEYVVSNRSIDKWAKEIFDIINQ